MLFFAAIILVMMLLVVGLMLYWDERVEIIRVRATGESPELSLHPGDKFHLVSRARSFDPRTDAIVRAPPHDAIAHAAVPPRPRIISPCWRDHLVSRASHTLFSSSRTSGRPPKTQWPPSSCSFGVYCQRSTSFSTSTTWTTLAISSCTSITRARCSCSSHRATFCPRTAGVKSSTPSIPTSPSCSCTSRIQAAAPPSLCCAHTSAHATWRMPYSPAGQPWAQFEFESK